MGDTPPCPGCQFRLWPCPCFAEATGHPAICAHQARRARLWGPIIYRLTMGRPPGDGSAPEPDPHAAPAPCCGQADTSTFFGDAPEATP